MQLTEISLIPLPFRMSGGTYVTSYGSRDRLDNLLLLARTDNNLIGLGEIARRSGSNDIPADAAMAASYRKHLQPLMGCNPENLIDVVNKLGTLSEAQSNLKTAVECACLDLSARARQMPLYQLFGGQHNSDLPDYASISQADPDVMQEQTRSSITAGHRVIQIKIGGERDLKLDVARLSAISEVLSPDSQLLIDANGAFSSQQAAALVQQCNEPGYLWEEPCSSYEQNAQLVTETGARVILDQCMTSPVVAARACADGLVAGYGIKCTMQGGPMAARTARDLAIAHGLLMKVDDCWCSDVGCALAVHLAAGIPADLLIATVNMSSYLEGDVSTEGLQSQAGVMQVQQGIGLGLTPDLQALPDPLEVINPTT